MKKILLILMAVCCLYSANAITSITALITVTNTPAGTGSELLQLQSSLYLWTNAIPAYSQIQSTNNLVNSTTNLFNRINSDYSTVLRISYSSPTSIVVSTYVNGSLNITNSTGWMTLVLTTNTPNAGALTGMIESNFTATTSFTLNGVTITSWPGVGGSATNVFFGPGTNTTVHYSNGTNYFDVLPGIFDIFGVAATVGANVTNYANGVTNTLVAQSTKWTGNTNTYTGEVDVGLLGVGSLFYVNNGGNVKANSIIDSGTLSFDSAAGYSDGVGGLHANEFYGTFSGPHYGDGSGLTNLNVSAQALTKFNVSTNMNIANVSQEANYTNWIELTGFTNNLWNTVYKINANNQFASASTVGYFITNVSGQFRLEDTNLNIYHFRNTSPLGQWTDNLETGSGVGDWGRIEDFSATGDSGARLLANLSYTAGTVINGIIIQRGSTNIYFNDLNTALAAQQGNDVILIPNNNPSLNLFITNNPNVLLSGVSIKGQGPNATLIQYTTNGFTPGSFSNTLSGFKMVSTNLDQFSASTGPATLSNGAILVSAGTTNFLIDSVNINCLGCGLINSSPSGQPTYMTINNCKWNGICRDIFENNIDAGSVTYLQNSRFFTYFPTNIPGYYYKNVTVSLAGGTNFLSNFQVTENLNGYPGTNAYNGGEQIALFVGGSGTTYLKQIDIQPLGGCNRALLMESTGPIYHDDSIPSVYYVYSTSVGTEYMSSEDWTKLGINDLSVIGSSGLIITNQNLWSTPSTNAISFSYGDLPSLQYFTNHFMGFTNALSFNFYGYPLGPTNNMVVSNPNGLSITFWATNGLWITNGMLATATIKDFLFVTNMQNINTYLFWNVNANSSYIISGAPNGFPLVYTNVPQSGLVGGGSTLGAWTSYTPYYGVSYHGGAGVNAAITNVWVANMPTPGSRGKQISISIDNTAPITLHSNIWSLVTATNGMVNMDNRWTISNTTPVEIFWSNGVPIIHFEATDAGGLLP